TQGIVICILMIVIAALYYFFRPEVFTLPAAATLFILLLMLVFYSGFMRLGGYQKIAIRTVLASFIVNLFLNLSFYPSLMQYQSGSEAAVWINQNNTRSLPVAMFLEDNPAPFIFYNDRHVATLKYDDTEPLPARPFLLYVPATEVAGLQAKGWQLRPLATFQRYWVTRLNGTFLNHATRGKVLTQMVVAEVK
ncbi:MAG TPA: glycosyl transferase, partial [Mucilaginibacter sp.]